MSDPLPNLTGSMPVHEPTVNQLGPGSAAPFDPATQVASQFLLGDLGSVPTSEVDPWLGKPLGNYILDNLLGVGGMGRVYEAKHRWLDNPVAVKVLSPSFNGNPEAIRRFHREAKLAASLNHPNIVKATDGGPIGNSFFLVTELIRGQNLADLVRSTGPLPIEAAAWLIQQVADGLQHAHQTGLVHRDIKPSNIMLPVEGPVKILDLGLARLAESESNLTSTGQFMGTLDYVSPEQATDTRGVNHKSDIYSLGCTLYFLVTGRAPFEGNAYETAASKILAHAEEEPVPVKKLRRDIPSQLVEVLECAMAKFPEDRFESATDFAKALKPFADARLVESLRQPAQVPMPQAKTEVALTFIEAVESFSERVLHVMWIVIRTMLLMVGLLRREEDPQKSRWSKRRFRYAINPKGVFLFLVIGGFVALILFGGVIEFVEVEPQRNSYYVP